MESYKFSSIEEYRENRRLKIDAIAVSMILIAVLMTAILT